MVETHVMTKGCKMTFEQTDRFQPMALIKVFREQIAQLGDKIADESISHDTKQFLKGAQTAMAFAAVTVQEMAMAKDRFILKERVL